MFKRVRLPKNLFSAKKNPSNAVKLDKSGISQREQKFFKTFRLINNLLIVIVVALGALVAYKFSQMDTEINIPMPRVSSVGDVGVNAVGDISGQDEVRAYDHYSAVIQQRDIFKLEIEQPQVAKPKEIREKRASQKDVSRFSRSLRLVGIVLSDIPEAIIEDKKTKETLFLHTGDQYNDAVVESIEESKVIFLYNNDKIELEQ